jgi:CRISPR-associated protein Cst1
MEEKIILYPSNWLYNAGVVGLLKILKEEDLKKVEFDSGNVRIPKDWFIPKDEFPIPYIGRLLIDKIVSDEDLNDWLPKKDKKSEKTNEEKYKDFVNKHFSNFHKEGYKYVRARGKLFGSNTPFQNLVQPKEWSEFQLFELIKDFVEQDNNGQLVCTFCKRKNIPFEFLKKEKSLEKRLIIFADPHTDELGASIGKFPNSFWNNKSSIFICPFCVYLFIHHRLAFIPTSEGEIFINAPDFKLIWDLNRFAENILTKSKEYEIRKILGSSLLQWAIKRRALLGAWTMMNIEVIVKKGDTIDYFDLPQDITKILLDPEIANLIERINEEKIFDLILRGKFSEIEKANYFVLKAILKLKKKEKISENDPIKKYFTNDNLEYLKKVSEILPELYLKILEKIGR